MAKSWGEVLSPLTQSYSINAAIQSYGGSKPALIAAYAGTTDRKSAAYQTANRNINRWQAAQQPQYGPLRPGEKARQARHITAQSQKKLDQVARAQLKKASPLPHLNLNGTIGINGYGEDYEREREIDKDISWDHLDDLAEAYRAGGDDAANDAFAEWYGDGGITTFYMAEGGDYSLEW